MGVQLIHFLWLKLLDFENFEESVMSCASYAFDQTKANSCTWNGHYL